MRILHIIYDDIGNPWLGGGGATRTLEIYSRIAQRGHKVLVVCGKYPGAADRELRRGVLYRRVGLGASYVLSRLTFMAGAVRLIRRGGYDIVIEDVSPFSPVGSPIWKPRSVPAAASVQNLSGAHAVDKYGPMGFGPKLVENPLLARFTNFIAVSPGIERQLRDMVKHDISVCVVPNSVDPVFFESRDAKPPEGVTGEYILSLGRIDVYQKGLDRLIEAFDLFAERVPNVNLVIAGGGAPAQENALKSLVTKASHRKRIQLLGPVAQKEAAQLMQHALLLAMPSRYEAWPLTALEAGAAGIPVLGADIVGVRDAAPAYPKAHGVLTPEGDTEALTQEFVKLTADKELRTKIGATGRNWASQFTWDKLADDQLAYYEQVINKQ